jgi:hypothetical protein
LSHTFEGVGQARLPAGAASDSLRGGCRPVPPAEVPLANHRDAEEQRPLCRHDPESGGE